MNFNKTGYIKVGSLGNSKNSDIKNSDRFFYSTEYP